MCEPLFFSRDVSDDELAADIAALQEGRFPAWRLSGTATYQATRGLGSAVELHSFTRIWLDDGAGHTTVVTVERARDAHLWHRIAVPGDGTSLPL